MTVAEYDTRVQDTASGSVDAFAFTFPIVEEGDIAVYLTPSGSTPNDATDIQTLNVDYTVSFNALPGHGGTVTFTSTPSAGDTITLEQNMALTQPQDFTVGGAYTMAALMAALDRLTLEVTQVKYLMENRGLTYDATLTLGTGNTNLPKLGALQYWKANASGNLYAATDEEDPDVSTLRSELASQTVGAPGTDVIGYYDLLSTTGRTLTAFLNKLQGQGSSDNGGAYIGYYDQVLGAATTIKAQLDTLTASQQASVGEIRAEIANPASDSAPSGWVWMRDLTIGNAASGATERANADCEDLFERIWNTVSDTYAPVTPGRGASAAADWGANKTIQLCTTLGRAMCNQGSGAGLTTRAAGEALGEEEHTLAKAELPHHYHSLRTSHFGSGPETDTDLPNISKDSNPQYVGSWDKGITNNGAEDGLAGDAHNTMQPSFFVAFRIKL